jgi:uncharacterized membrane protein YcfT
MLYQSANARVRVAWADAAKGVCILLVVLWHVIMKHYLKVDWRQLPVPIPGAWGALGEQLLTLRMPLFFTISGMFAVGAYHRDWRVVARSRVAKFLYLYLLWTLIHTAALWRMPNFDTTTPRSVGQAVEMLTITPPNLWYLYALALYFTLAKAARRIPWPILTAAAGILAVVAAADLIPTPGNRGSLLQNFVFFLSGLHLRPHVERLAARASWRRLVVAASAYVLALAGMAVSGAQRVPGIWLVVCVVAVVFGVTAAPLVARQRFVGAGLAWVGRHTLAIYVMHMPILALAHLLLVDPVSGAGPVARIGLAVVLPVVVTGIVVAVCLGLERLLRRAGTKWLFDLPQRLLPRPRRPRPTVETVAIER